MGDTVTSPLPASSEGLFSEFRREVTNLLDSGIAILENEQSKINSAMFDALSMDQRDAFCQSLARQNVKPKRIEKITGKSQPTINRHLNGKNS